MERTLQKKRTTNFREDETKLLIQLWGSPQIQNKLYLTHRKEPVMRLLAVNMQQRGFYRTPDEIKTRIRNLKCLYHRIKRTMQSGTGIGTVDPDWPHYKAMDVILSKQSQKKENIYKESVFEGPHRCEDIKQEIDEIDINDDMESYTTNSMHELEYEDEHMSMPTLTPAPKEETKNGLKMSKQLPKILPHPPVQNSQTTVPTSIPFPLLILNGLQPQNLLQEKKDTKILKTSPEVQNNDVVNVLKELLEVQKENLEIEKKRLELENQRLDFERFIGSQLLTLGPILSSICQQEKPNRKGQAPCDITSIFKDNKILKTLLSEGFKTYEMDDEASENEDDEDNTLHDDK